VYVRDYQGAVIAAARPMLHAAELGFVHPLKNEEVKFSVDPPDDFQRVLAQLAL